jgi:hypothetical protein
MEERILDEKTRTELYGFFPFTTDVSVPFTPKQYDNIKEDYRPIFWVRPLLQKETDQIRVNYSLIPDKASDSEYSELNKKNTAIILGFITDFKNFWDMSTGKEIKYNNDIPGGFNWSEVRPWWIATEIVSFINKISGLLTVEKISLVS